MEEGYTYEDILVAPRYSEVMSRSETSLDSKLTSRITLKTPIISSNMDTITEDRMAIAMAINGGLGIIHRYCSIEEQVDMVRRVKRHTNFLIENPYTIPDTATINDVDTLMQKKGVGCILVIDSESHLVGIVTRRDMRLGKFENKSMLREIMTTTVITGTIQDVEERKVKRILLEYRLENLPIIDENNKILGLVTLKDLLHLENHGSLLDKDCRLVVGAAVGVKDDYLERTAQLIAAGCDIICVDVAHGHHKLCGDAVRNIKQNHNIDVIAGNVCTPEGVRYLAECGADSIKVNIGAGTICVTRIQTGNGYPQFSAVYNCVQEAKKHNVSIIADGGHSGITGSIFKALAAGAACSMLGGMLAGTDETPGEVVIKSNKKCKIIRGMAGRISNMKKSLRTGTTLDVENMVPEGVEGYVPYKGEVRHILHQICGGLRSGLSYQGCHTIKQLHETDVRFVKITNSAIRESGSHGISEM